MPQEPQQVDLEELTRLHEMADLNGVRQLRWLNAISDAFPALRDELNDTRRWKSNLYQDRCESAYIEVSLFDAAKQALSEVAPDHPFLKGEPPSFGVWEKLSKENAEMRDELVTARKNNKDLLQDSCDVQEAAIECAKSFGVCIDNGPGYGQPNIFQLLEDIQKAGDTMRDELVRLREEREQWRMSSVCREYKRQLDEAKGLLGAALNMYLMAGHKEARGKASVIAVTVLAEMGIEVNRDDFEIQRSSFLASLAGTEVHLLKDNTCPCCLHKVTQAEFFAGKCDCGVRLSPLNATPQQEQPTQGEVAWHDVTKSLPEYMTSALVWCPANKNIYCAYSHFYAGSQDPESKPIWCYFTQEGTITTLKEEVTHWTTLPTPPPEVEKELPPCCDFCAKPETDCSCIDDAERQEVEGGEG